ncbi:MAG: hypoxanthine-guanine phosphoribosyltransferase, partial [Betaproteobacteria bacterium]|nr:hypoxanthine-guanine phosphoribosyltransferase [Betaproteobacteria bacterium]
MLSAEQARELWANSEEIVSEDAVRGSLDRM